MCELKNLCAECSFKKVCKVKKENERLKENIMQMFSTNDIIDEKMDKLRIKNKTLKAKLEIAVKALEEIVADESCVSCMDCVGSAYAREALAKIKDIKG